LEGNFLPKGNIVLWRDKDKECSLEGNKREIWSYLDGKWKEISLSHDDEYPPFLGGI
jgi:hypothetical protein